jgi:uncharacterized protein (TIGR00251 family)
VHASYFRFFPGPSRGGHKVPIDILLLAFLRAGWGVILFYLSPSNHAAPQKMSTRQPVSSAPAPSASAASCKLAIRAVPNAPCNAVAGWLGDALKVKVRAPALEGRANGELCEFLAGALGLPRRAVSVAHGEKSRQKVIQIDGLSPGEVRARLKV